MKALKTVVDFFLSFEYFSTEIDWNWNNFRTYLKLGLFCFSQLRFLTSLFNRIFSQLHVKWNFSFFPLPALLQHACLLQSLPWAPINGSVWNKIISLSVSLTWSIFLPCFSHSFQFHGEAQCHPVKQMTKSFGLNVRDVLFLNYY